MCVYIFNSFLFAEIARKILLYSCLADAFFLIIFKIYFPF